MSPLRCRITLADHAAWQRRANTVLAVILDRHRALTPLRWSLAPHGCGLTGVVVAPDAYTIEHTFAEWRAVLCLSFKSPAPGVLSATGQLDGCRIAITATLPTQKGKSS